MKNKENHIIYTAADFERYYAGKMSVAEMHALEKAAMDDPFLGDALEGYRHTADPENDLSAIQLLLEKRTEAKPPDNKINKAGFGWLKIAAAVLALGFAGYFLLKDDESSKPELATLDRKLPAEQVQNGLAVDSLSKANAPATAMTDSVPGVGTEKPLSQAYINPANPEALSKIPDRKENNKDIASDAATTPPVYAAEEKAAELDYKTEAAKENIAFERDKVRYGNQMVTGQIVNEKGEPVPFATVQNKVSTVSSDAEGKFKLPVTDSLSVASVTATGYDSKMMYNINPKQQQTVVLNSNQQQLNEVVVSSSAVAKKKNLTKSVTNIAVNAPVNGWAQFNNYIALNKQNCTDENGTALKGVVELSFKVNKAGKPVKVRVEKSLSASCDKEAIRLLTNGPAWVISGNNRITTKIEL